MPPDAATEPELDFLIEHRSRLTPAEKGRLRELLRMKERGYRTNAIIDRVRPVVHPKQREFLRNNHLEAMFGGSAGGSKSDSLLIAALQYVDVPGYSALLMRRTFTDLALSGALIPRLASWLIEAPAKWNSQQHTWTFQSGATLSFGYAESKIEAQRYRSAEYQFIGIDELTEHEEETYLFMFSRLRRLKNSKIPIRMRSATNPGGRHGDWVKRRFIPDEYLKANEETQFSRSWIKSEPCGDCAGTGTIREAGKEDQECLYCDGIGQQIRHFIPARVKDNPSLDEREYRKSLSLLGSVERYRLEHGRWDIAEEGGLFRQSWFRYYERRGENFILHIPDEDSPLGFKSQVVSRENVCIFITADTASKEKTSADYTVICAWGLDLVKFNLILLAAHREKMEVPAVLPAVRNAAISSGAEFVMIEDAASGIGVIQGLRGKDGHGISVKSYNPNHNDKVGRSTVAQIRMEAGQIYFPVGNPGWLDPIIAELLGFPVGEHDDCVDNFSMASHYAQHHARMLGEGTGLPTQISKGLEMPVGAGGLAGRGNIPTFHGIREALGGFPGGGPGSGGSLGGMLRGGRF